MEILKNGSMEKAAEFDEKNDIKVRFECGRCGGEWTAWYCDADEVPSEIASDDLTCGHFWDRAHDATISRFLSMEYMTNGDFECPVFGVGGTIETAVADLKRRLESCDKA